jgi:hypothetical protein
MYILQHLVTYQFTGQSILTGLGAIGIAFLSLYGMIRLEFASLVIYWDIETQSTDLGTSIRMTKYHFLEKLKIIIIANIPSFVLGLITTITFFIDFTGPLMPFKWLLVFISISINILFYSWSYSFYYPMFEQLKAFALPTEKSVDKDGREWLTF